MKRIAMAFVCALLSLAALAQSANMMSMARAELAKRGLEENEVRARLLEEGIDVDTIPPTEYAQYQDRVMSVLNKMQAEKAAVAGDLEASVPAAPAGEELIAAAAEESLTPNDFPQTTRGEAAAEEALSQALADNNVSTTAGDDIYGHSFFTGKTMDVFRTTDGAQAPDTYVLGVGDEVHISIFGSSQTEIHQRIGADGSIQPTGSTKIFLKGMTLAQGRSAIRNRLATHYSFRPDQIAVTITTARTVTVSIYGEVGVQGGFTLSALNTVYNALSAAGGPTRIGTVRNIQLSRSGKTYRLDLYEYMNNPNSGFDYDIQNGDILFVPVAQKVVGIQGAVNRPMNYEMAEGESLKDLVQLAGGLRHDAHPEFVQIERFENGEQKYLEYNLANIMNGKEKVSLSAGDVVRIRTANEPLDQYVSAVGDVYYEGSYDLLNNHSLKRLLENAKPRHTARTDYLFVERTRVDESVEVLTVPFPADGQPDFTLQARDVVRVLNQVTYRDLETISVNGQVRNPFTRSFSLNDQMSISQAIEYAGGLKTTVFPIAYIFRRDVTNPEKMSYIRVNLDKDGSKLLKPGDQLNVYDNSTYTNIGEVRVSGAVKNPVGTAYDESLTLHDLLTMAGGFDIGAAYDHVEVFRVDIDNYKEALHKVISLTVDQDYNIVGKDFQLQPYDHIVVRQTPNFSLGRTVEINGRVKYPGLYVLEDSRTQLSEIIELAGGLLDDADPYTYLFRTYNGRGNIGINLNEMKHHKRNVNSDPILMEGDVVNVVRMENTVIIRETGTRMAQYTPAEFSSTQTAVVYSGRHTAAWYVKHFAGGFDRTTDRNSVTVTMPNNKTEATRHFLFFRRTPMVEPGSVITMRIDQRKKERIEKPKEKVDWENVAAKSLSSLTSIVSMILLIERLN